MIKKIYLILLSIIAINSAANLKAVVDKIDSILDNLPSDKIEKYNKGYIKTDLAKKILGVSKYSLDDLTDKQIRTNYHKLSLIYHPDKNSGSEERFILLERAYNILMNRNDAVEILNRQAYEETSKTAKKDRNQNYLEIIKILHLYYDLFVTLMDICKIKALGSQNSSLIRLGAIIGLTKAITHSDLSYQIDILVSIINLNYYKKFNTIQKNLDAFKNTANIKFIIDNAIIFANAEKIANYNKEEPRNLSKAKTTQYIWLAVNKLIPYAAFAFIRKFNENCKISDIFTDYKKLKKRSFQSYTTIRTIASISEIIRQIALQCLENCQYKKHQTNDVNKNR